MEDNIKKKSKLVRSATKDQQPEGIYLCSAHRTVTTARLWLTSPQNEIATTQNGCMWPRRNFLPPRLLSVKPVH